MFFQTQQSHGLAEALRFFCKHESASNWTHIHINKENNRSMVRFMEMRDAL